MSIFKRLGLGKIFGQSSGNDNRQDGILPAEPLGDDFEPKNGSFFQTLEYPEFGTDNETVVGRSWMEAGKNPDTGKWVLWLKSVKEREDVINGGTEVVRNNTVLYEDISFANAYAQMDTFEKSMRTQNIEPLKNKTPAKLGVDYAKHFAWAEGTMMSRSGRLYPVSDELLSAENYFNEQDLTDAKAFLDRYKQEKFVAVPIILPCTDWEKAYEANKERTDTRLRALYTRYDNDMNSYDLAKQIVAHEDPAVLYAHLKNGFNPKIFEDAPEQNFELLQAAIDRKSVEPLSLLAEAGINFFVRYNEETPVEHALREKRYSHLRIMLSRDGVRLVNYADETGISPAIQAIELRDNQSFRMLYVEGIDFSHADDNGWFLVHHAFDNNFMRGVYAWIDEELPIDMKVEGTDYTGVSLARHKGHQELVSFAISKGADPYAPQYEVENTEPEQPGEPNTDSSDTTAPQPEDETVPDFSLNLLSTDATNEQIKKSAQAYVDNGGDLNILDNDGSALFEICWKNIKESRPELNRRALIEFFGELGADPSATLADGTTVLTREAKSSDFDLEFITAIAPFAKDVNNTDHDGENIMHAMQLNANDQVGHSRNIKAVLKLFPALDLNQQNNDGYSNIGLAIRLSRSNTMKEFIKALVVNDAIADLSQTTQGDWSYLDIAFTAAFNEEKGKDFPLWANRIDTISDRLRKNVLGMVNRVMTDGNETQRQALYGVLNRTRPDGKTLGQAMTEEQVSGQLINGLSAWGMQKPQGPGAPGAQPG